ncbi:hypothetical protein M8A51_18010 [Schlegelella sp. S2-27]|uniref:Asl1-like glycosyl hydrolase catalytic domain-containing protein n=1 Tax=Caldimonas mangrovi TaxID=2944811 RepID=A0ABT0YRS5_9BURK|nr:glycosyl hydrolase [Caldimonas mangrovi]MCM5681426.1 hypothetical protein [Caldimonas mangrovi]
MFSFSRTWKPVTTALFAAVLAACGGGGTGTDEDLAADDVAVETAAADLPAVDGEFAGLADAEAQDASTLMQAAAVSSATTVLALPESGGSSVQVNRLVTSTMDGAFNATASGWKVNYWGTPTPGYYVGRETRAGYVRSGAASQQFRMSRKGNGDVHLTYTYAFSKGKTYRSTLYIRSDVPAEVVVQMRRDAAPWDAFGVKTVKVGTSWQKVEITGAYPGTVKGTLRIASQTPGANLWIDDVAIDELQYNEMAPFSQQPIPDTLFGMHVNKFGWHQNYPQLGHHVVRMWNTGTTWRDLEPRNNEWTFTGTEPGGKRLDMMVTYIKRNDPGAAILYTLGQTPQWASSTPGAHGLYGDGAAGAPVRMEDWRDYVRTLAQRYAGKIQYWELWNEPDYAPHYNGTMAQMVEMARIAKEELKAADPNNKLVSPGVTAGQGMAFLNNFLAQGGGAHVDIIGFHWYFDTSPEKIGPVIGNVRQMMTNYGVGNKPLWNTEGAPGCDSLIYTCSTFQPSPEQIRSTTARALMMMWAKGVSNFNYYFWESTSKLARLVESDFRTPTEAAKAYSTMVRWMRGARLVDAYAVNQQVYMFKLNRGTEYHYVLWSTQEGQRVQLPAGWKASSMVNLQDTSAALPASREITLGLEPVLLKP